MDESFALAIHKALHNWRDVEGTVDLLGDGEIVSFSTSANGCRVAEWKGHRLMEQNKSKATKWAKMAKKGSRITWVMTGRPWGLILDDAVVRRCSAIKESKKTNAVESSDDEEEEEVGRPAEKPKNCVSSEGEADESEEEEVEEEEEEELDMSNLSNHKMDELRAFTKKQGIKVVGRRKDDVIKAIKKWNEQRKEEAKKKAQKKKQEKVSKKSISSDEGEEEEEGTSKPASRPAKRESKVKAVESEAEADDIQTKRPSLKEAAEAKKDTEIASPRKPASGDDKAETIEQIQEEAEKGKKENEATVEEKDKVVEEVEEKRDEEEEEGDLDSDLENGLDLSTLESYSLKTLKAYCADESVKVSGGKRQDYIKAILAYNECPEEDQDDEAEAEAEAEAEVPKRTSVEASADLKKALRSPLLQAEREETLREEEQLAATVRASKEEPKRKPESEANSQERKEERQAEEDDDGKEEDIDEMDLDLLDCYSMATLKRYCEAEEIAVRGARKEDYIKAILAYNEDAGKQCSWLEVSQADEEHDTPAETASANAKEGTVDASIAEMLEGRHPLLQAPRRCDLQPTTRVSRHEEEGDDESDAGTGQATQPYDVEKTNLSSSAGEEETAEMWKKKAMKWKLRAKALQKSLDELTKGARRTSNRSAGKENSPRVVASKKVRA